MKSKLRLTYERILAYFGNKMTEKEKHAFEKSVMMDEFESDAYDGLSKLGSLEIEQDLEELKLSLESKMNSKQKKRLIWLPYAASIIVILGLSFVLYFINQTPRGNEFVSQDIEQAKPKQKFESIQITKEDSLNISTDQPIEELEEVELVEEKGIDVVDLEVQMADEYEELQFAQEIKDEEIETSEPILKVLKVKENQSSRIVTNKVEKALSGKVAGVTVSKRDTGIRIRGFATIGNDENARKISGLVVDKEKTPIPGVMIVVNGTTKGTMTDLDGKFAMSLADTNSNYKLTASFVGFETKEVDVADSLLVVLEQDAVEMNEVVVTAYGSEKKKAFETGSVSEVKMDKPIKSWNKVLPSQSKNISIYKENMISSLKSEFETELTGRYKLRVSFIVYSSGSIGNVKVKGDNNLKLTKKIKELIRNGEKWIPAESNDAPTDSKVRFTLRVDFD
ncbi:carboxypeptidase-like regulatory domain-containing protein [Marinifilum sp. D714]|uniref:carboxypeptidase-like regulatory domain-containing protein n=1 Tax=Marinifilum sp. D714 TaxID=2937523 RepID=UPI0027C87485|nr:carboxypeptidase-like regulatory domain-containing protein [Marinifilum sp. D714]MDQ2179460.1 carboxypeptidase-like regulatory domain-containing protein [Marinifilum sp. D714]